MMCVKTGVGHNVRPDLHHLVHPIRGNTAAKMDYGVMWTHTKGLQADPSRWGPNHFVVCLPPSILFICYGCAVYSGTSQLRPSKVKGNEVVIGCRS